MSHNPTHPEAPMNRSPALTRTCIGLAVFLFAAANALAGVVTSTANSGAGSLRDTLAAAASGETITFSLAMPATIGLSSELPLSQSVTIQGPGANLLTISSATGRVFNLDTAARTWSPRRPSHRAEPVRRRRRHHQQRRQPDHRLVVDRQQHVARRRRGDTQQLQSLDRLLAHDPEQHDCRQHGEQERRDLLHRLRPDDREQHDLQQPCQRQLGGDRLVRGFGFIRNSTIAATRQHGWRHQPGFAAAFEHDRRQQHRSTGINDLKRTGGGNGSFVNATNSLFTEVFLAGDNVLNGPTVSGNLIGVDPQLGALADNGGPTRTLGPGRPARSARASTCKAMRTISAGPDSRAMPIRRARPATSTSAPSSVTFWRHR
jgi:hypothetical protein